MSEIGDGEMINKEDLHVFDESKRASIANSVNGAIQQIEDKIAQCKTRYPIAKDTDFDDVRKKLAIVRSRLTKKSIQIAFIADPQTGKSTLVNRLFVPTPPQDQGFDYYNRLDLPEVLATSGRNADATTSCIVSYTTGGESKFVIEPFSKNQKSQKFDSLLKICRDKYKSSEDDLDYIQKIESTKEGELAKWMKIKHFLLYGKPILGINQAKELAKNRKINDKQDDVPFCSDEHFVLAYAESKSERKFEDRPAYMNLSVSQNSLSQLIYKINIEGLSNSGLRDYYKIDGNNVSVSQRVTLVDVPGFNADPCDQFLFDEYLEQEYPEADGYIFLMKSTQPGGITFDNLCEKIRARAIEFGLNKTNRIVLGISRMDQVQKHSLPKEKTQHLLETYKKRADGWGLDSGRVFLIDLKNTGTDSSKWTEISINSWMDLRGKLENGAFEFFENAINDLYEPGNGGVNALRKYINGEWLEKIADENYKECLFDIEVARAKCDKTIAAIELKSSLNVHQKEQIIFALGRINVTKNELRADCSYFQNLVQAKRNEIYKLMAIHRRGAPPLGIPVNELSGFIKSVVKSLFQKSLMGILVPASITPDQFGDCPVEGAWRHVSEKLDAEGILEVPFHQSNGQIGNTGLSSLWSGRYQGLSEADKQAIATANDDPVPLVADIWGAKAPSLKEIIRNNRFLNRFMKSADENIDVIANKIAVDGLDSNPVRQNLFSLIFSAIDDVFSEASYILQQFVLQELDSMSSDLKAIG